MRRPSEIQNGFQQTAEKEREKLKNHKESSAERRKRGDSCKKVQNGMAHGRMNEKKSVIMILPVNRKNARP